jgi:hypothetical protein
MAFGCSVTSDEKEAQQGARANVPTCHDSCRARNRASSCRGSSLTFGKMLRLSLIGVAFLFASCATRVVDAAAIEAAARSGVCCVHSVTMEKQVTVVQYGFWASPFGAARRAQDSEFPFALRLVFGGGTLSLDGPCSTNIFVCSRCEEAKSRWIRRNPSHPWAKAWSEERKPNKAPEPTPRPVMIPAEPGITPGRVVAHL